MDGLNEYLVLENAALTKKLDAKEFEILELKDMVEDQAIIHRQRLADRDDTIDDLNETINEQSRIKLSLRRQLWKHIRSAENSLQIAQRYAKQNETLRYQIQNKGFVPIGRGVSAANSEELQNMVQILRRYRQQYEVSGHTGDTDDEAENDEDENDMETMTAAWREFINTRHL